MSQLKDSQHLKLSFKVIKEATENFKTCIGKGGYGRVYKGQLLISGQVTIVAVKRLYEQFGQGSKEFLTEIELLRGQNHPNLIFLLGYCEEGEEKIIVYEYAERGSLDQYISLNKTTYSLSWLERLRICVAIARGLDHLHNHIGKHQAVIHRDIKSANILLDHNWVAKISDLGLSKLSLAGLNRSAVISNVCGTPVYCEPEYMITGIVKKESDVFSFGMVLLEILCGRLCTIRDDDGFFLLDYYKRNKLHRIIDPILRQQMSSDSLIKFLAIASRCLHERREQRHPMDRVVKELEEVLKIEDQLESSFGFPNAEETSGSQLNSINSFVEDEEKDAPLVMGYDPAQVKDSESMQFSAMVENMSMSDSEYEVKIENDRLVYQNELDISSLQIIKNEDLEQLRELGSDKFGTLYHGKWRGTDVAIQQKKFAVESSEQERLTVEFWRKAVILSMLRHPNIVAFYGVVQDGPGGILAAVTEFMVDGSLRRVLLSKDRHLNGQKRHIIAMDAAFGMEYLHSKNIVHFNLKCEKLLVNIKDPSRPVCKVGDFGLSRIKRNTLVSNGVRGTLPWMAPELLNGSKNEVSEKVDVFSFGIVLWEILTGEEPYADMQDDAIIEGIVSNTLRPSIPKDCDHEWRRLMEQCWAPNPAVRPSFTEITRRLRVMLSNYIKGSNDYD